MRRKANHLLIWGIVLLVAGAVLALFLPNVLDAVGWPNMGTQLASNVSEVLVRTVNAVLPVLGAALLAAGITLRAVSGTIGGRE